MAVGNVDALHLNQTITVWLSCGRLLKEYIEEENIPRADVKALQHEDSHSVWNELDYYRREYEKLKKERPKLSEELDRLRVQRVSDKSTIKELELMVENNIEVIQEKEAALKSKVEHVSPSKMYSLQKQMEIWKEKAQSCDERLADAEEKRSRLDETVTLLQENERLLKAKLKQLSDEIATSIAKASAMNQMTQTDIDSDVLAALGRDPVDDDKPDTLTVSQLAGDQIQDHSGISMSTQTSLRKVQNKSLQIGSAEDPTYSCTDTEDDHSSADDRSSTRLVQSATENRKKQKSTNRDLLVSALKREKHSLLKRVRSLSVQATQLKDSKITLSKLVEDLRYDGDKMRDELVTCLQKLHSTKLQLQEKSKELETCIKERDVLLASQETEQRQAKFTNVEHKSMETKIEQLNDENSRLAFELRSCREDRDELSKKLKEAQDKTASLERAVSQKKALVDEWKVKYEDMKESIDSERESNDTLKLKVKQLQDRERKRKTQVDNLQQKIELLTQEKRNLLEEMSKRKLELDGLHQHVKQEEAVYKSVEKTIRELQENHAKHIDALQEKYRNTDRSKDREATLQNEKIEEFKSVLTNFVRIILGRIQHLRSTVLERHQAISAAERVRRQEELLSGPARDIACSILSMSASDIQQFMDADSAADTELILPEFHEKDTVEKVNTIMNRKSNFGRVLTQLLVELVDYNWTLKEHELNVVDR